MDDSQTANLPTCAECHQAFQWDQAYQTQDTPGSGSSNPPGHGVFRPRAYCPNCGELVAEWHINRVKDYNEWAWYGDNAAPNTGKPLPPNPMLAWGKSIPVAYRPTIQEHRLAVEKIKAQEGVVQPEEPESTEASGALVQQGYQLLKDGDLEKACQVFDQAAAAGLNKHDYACALGSAGLYYLWKRQDVEQAFRYCRGGVERDPAAYWQAHYILYLIYQGAGEQEKAQKELGDAHRFALTRWWEEDFERELKTDLRAWVDLHGKDALKAVILTATSAVVGVGVVPAAFVAPAPGQGTKKCPRCAEEIKLEARFCRFCGASFKIVESGYCPVCFRMVEPSPDGKCPTCHTDIPDRRVSSTYLEDPASPGQTAGTETAAATPESPSPYAPSPEPMPLWKLYFSPNGRIGRATFFLKGVLPTFALLFLVAFIIFQGGRLISTSQTEEKLNNIGMMIYAGTSLLVLWIWLMLIVKRFHDLNRSGWNILLWILPFVGQFIYLINLIECFFVKGKEPNRFGGGGSKGYVAPPVPAGARITRLAAAVLAVALIAIGFVYLTERGVIHLPTRLTVPRDPGISLQPSGTPRLALASRSTSTPKAALTSRPTRTPTPEPYTSAPPLPADSACFVGLTGGMVCLGPQGWYSDFGQELDFAKYGVYTMTSCPNGTALFYSYGGLVSFDGKRWEEIPKPEVGTPNAMTCGQEGEIWVAGYSGVARLDGETWTTYPIEQILNTTEAKEHPKGIALSPNGTVWLALDNSLARYQDGAWSLYREGQGFSKAYTLLGVVVDSKSIPWAAHTNGLLTLQGGTWKPVNLSGSTRVNTLAIDGQDRIWVGSTNNLWMYDKGQWKSFNLAQGGKSDASVTAVAIDDQGRAWAGTHWGLNVVDPKGKITTYHMHTSDLKDNRIEHALVLGGGPPLPDLAQETPGTLKGKFTRGGQPLAGAKVEVCMSSLGIFFSGATPCNGKPGFKSTQTDENGEFVLDDLPEGYYSVAVRKPDGKWTVYSCNLCFGSKSVLVTSGETMVLDTLEIK